jgi:hypothetical protein
MSVNNISSVNPFYYHGNGGVSPLRFLEIRGTVSSNTSNLFYSGNAYSINNLSIHFAYNGIASLKNLPIHQQNLPNISNTELPNVCP